MQIGKLRSRIQIQSVDNSSRNALGEPVEAWSTITDGTVWAQIQPIVGNEAFLAEQVNSTVTHKITIRSLSTVTAKHRVLFGDRIFDINSVRDIDERTEQMVLRCSEGK